VLKALQGIRCCAMSQPISRSPDNASAGNQPRRCVRLGVSTQAIDDTLYDAFGQRKIAQFFTQQNNYWVVLESIPIFSSIPTRSI